MQLLFMSLMKKRYPFTFLSVDYDTILNVTFLMQIFVPVIDSCDPAPLNDVKVRPVQCSPEDVPSSMHILLREASQPIRIFVK
jgi:hypothetical protein